MTENQKSSLIESVLFLIVIFIEAGMVLYLIHGRFIAGGQDGFQYFALQYVFLNNVVTSAEIPQWMPFMTHGSVANWWYVIQGSIFQNVLFLSGDLFKGVNFLPLFYTGIFLDELLLLAGTWLLARRFFASPFTVFFVALSVMGSSIWILQPWWNFHLYYAVPLILYFIHEFIDTGKVRYYFLAGNLLFMQCLGNLPYFLPVTSLIIFLYFLFYVMLNHRETWPKIKAVKFGRAFMLASLSIILLFIALKVCMTSGMDQIVNYNPLRNLDGTTTLDGFLTYGGQSSWSAWLELLLGISPFLDYTLYAGIICVPFILFGLFFNSTRQNSHFLFTIIILFFFSLGTFASVFFYYSWPLMKYFRHLALISPVIKVFLCFVAGAGFDAVFFNKSRLKNPRLIKISLAVTALFMLGLSLFLWILSGNYIFSVNLLLNIVPAKHTFFRTLLDEYVLTSLLDKTVFFAFTGAILFAVLSFIDSRKYFAPLLIVILILHGADIYGFKFSEIKFKTAALSDEMYKLTGFQAMPYSPKREVAFPGDNPRAGLLNILPIQYGAFFNWTTHSFLFKDELGNAFRTDHWLLPLDHYMRAYWGQSIHDLSAQPAGLVLYTRLDFPRSHPAALKISGVTEDKIQFFSEADIVASDDGMVSKITGNQYKGDVLFLSPAETGETETKHRLPETDLSSGRRLHPAYQVRRFDANNLELTTFNSSDHAWLLYSDVWHPLWRANVNGKQTPVYRANLAYKAVQLEKGVNTVHFYFKSRLISAFFFIFSLNALGWLVMIVYLNADILRNKKTYKDT